MDAVILAAGKGTRLEGVAAPFHKPLMVVNGTPLIVQAVDACAVSQNGETIVVVAPENALPISQVLGARDVRMVIQRDARGPGHALLMGLKALNCRESSHQALVLMGDNVTPIEEVQKIVTAPFRHDIVIGIQKVGHDFERFTRCRRGRWVENTQTSAEDYESDGFATCWLGPLRVSVADMRNRLQDACKRGTGREVPIGRYLNGWNDPCYVDTTTIDIGVPEALA